MRYNELVQLLEKHGFVWINSGKSSKRIYSNGTRTVLIHYHATQDRQEGNAEKNPERRGHQRIKRTWNQNKGDNT